MRYLEVTKDQWQFGKDNTVRHRGQRFFEEDDEAARVWVGMGLVKYVEDDYGQQVNEVRAETRAMSTETADALLEPSSGGKRGRYARRDMRARD